MYMRHSSTCTNNFLITHKLYEGNLQLAFLLLSCLTFCHTVAGSIQVYTCTVHVDITLHPASYTVSSCPSFVLPANM